MEKAEEAVLTESQKFQEFVDRLVKNGFRLVHPREKKEYQKAINLTPPEGRPKRPGQIFLIYTHITGMRVIVWPTFSPSIQDIIPKGEAMGWVLIIDKHSKDPDYFNPVKRVGLYWNDLKDSAIACQQRVENRPRCKKCGEFMNIARRRGVLKARFWRCKEHLSERESWDHGLSPEKLEAVKVKRKSRAKYRDSRKKEGKSVHTAMLTRKKWKKKEI